MRNVLRDVRQGLRTAWRSPGYGAITALTLALAIGANTLLFSIANPLIVRALPHSGSDTLGWIISTNPEREITRDLSSLPDFLEWRARLKSFTSSGRLQAGRRHPHGSRRRQAHRDRRGAANLFEVWGIRPQTGRLFQPGEDTPGRDACRHPQPSLLHEAFAADPTVMNRSFLLDGQSLTIVGVMPASIEIGNLALVDIWTPLPLDTSAARDRRVLRVVGRLAPGATVASADAELQPILERQRRDHPRILAGWQSHVTFDECGTRGVGHLGHSRVARRDRRLRAAHCLRQPGEPRARAARVARVRRRPVRIALGASRWQLVRPAPRREPAAQSRGRSHRPRARVLAGSG